MSRPPLKDTPAIANLNETLADACTSIRRCFSDRVKVTVIVRNLDHPRGRDLIFSDDEWPDAKRAVEALLDDPMTEEGCV